MTPSRNGFRFGNYFLFGLCGGMVLGVLWMLKNHLVCKTENLPPVISKLFWKLLCWQVQSLLPFTIVKIYLHQCGILHYDSDLVMIKRRLRKGPVPIILIWRRSWNPIWLEEAHQVLAYGVVGGILFTYDPNWPCDDSVTITGQCHSHDGSIYRLFC